MSILGEETMAQLLADLFAIFATLPFISFFIIYFVALYRTKSKRESVRWAIHITMLFLLFTVSGMMKSITGSTAGFWWMVVILILLTGLVLFLQWRTRRQIQLVRALRSIWVLGFFIFTITYIVLIPIGIFTYFGRM